MATSPTDTLTQAQPVVSSGPHKSQNVQVLFDAMAQEGQASASRSSPYRWSAFMTGLLWIGYAAGLVVALMLIWSAAQSLLQTYQP